MSLLTTYEDDDSIIGGAEVPRVPKETTEEMIRRVVAEMKPSMVSYAQRESPRWRVIVEVIIAAGVIGLVAAHFEDGQFQAQVKSSLHYLKIEVGAIQAKVQAPFPSDPPVGAVAGDPPPGNQR